jgi:hypothetical protein
MLRALRAQQLRSDPGCTRDLVLPRRRSPKLPERRVQEHIGAVVNSHPTGLIPRGG